MGEKFGGGSASMSATKKKKTGDTSGRITKSTRAKAAKVMNTPGAVSRLTAAEMRTFTGETSSRLSDAERRKKK